MFLAAHYLNCRPPNVDRAQRGADPATRMVALGSRRRCRAKAFAERVLKCGCRISQGVEPAGHLPTLNVGCQKLRGQKRIEMKY